jgi:uncharacterized protein (DUF736 family)
MRYWYHVSGDKLPSLYQGHDAADAMAAWSKAVGDGEEYVTLEALREPELTGEVQT